MQRDDGSRWRCEVSLLRRAATLAGFAALARKCVYSLGHERILVRVVQLCVKECIKCLLLRFVSDHSLEGRRGLRAIRAQNVMLWLSCCYRVGYRADRTSVSSGHRLDFISAVVLVWYWSGRLAAFISSAVLV